MDDSSQEADNRNAKRTAGQFKKWKTGLADLTVSGPSVSLFDGCTIKLQSAHGVPAVGCEILVYDAISKVTWEIGLRSMEDVGRPELSSPYRLGAAHRSVYFSCESTTEGGARVFWVWPDTTT
jgi:hypothetical protein